MHGAGELLLPFLNFLALIGILAFYLRKPLAAFVSQRHQSVREELSQVRELLGSAQAKHREFTSRLSQLQVEIQQVNQQMKQDIQDVRTKINQEATTLSQNIVKDSAAAAQAMVLDVKEKLYRELSAQVLKRTEEIVRERLTGDDRIRIRQEFSNQVEKSQ